MRWSSILVVIALASSARADDKPWAAGVSGTNKSTAERLLGDGNALFLDKKYAPALDKYKQALVSWDHPAIRFNIVRCLIQLDRAVEASDNLELALKYGSAPFEETLYNEALGYQKLLANQIGDLEVRCEQPGVVLTLDGQDLAQCPASAVRRVIPGKHQVVATKRGFMTRTLDVLVIGHKRQEMTIALEPLTSAARVTHRWATWKPWLVFGVGVGIATVGGILELKASSDLNSYDRQVSRECPSVACDPAQLSSFDGLRSSASVENGTAIGMFAIGAATAVIGSVMLYLNRPRTEYPKPVETLITVVPLHGGGTVGVVGRF